MKEKLPKNFEDVDALDAELSDGPVDEDESKADQLDPETGLPLEEVSLAGLHIEDGESAEL